MDAVEFATKYAGKRFRLPLDLFDAENIENRMYRGFNPSGQVIGYINGDSERVVFEVDEFTEDCWPLHSGVVVTADKDDFYNPKWPIVMAVSYKRLDMPKTLEQVKEEMAKRKAADEKNKLSAYPNVCKSCNAPARKYGKRTMCSSSICCTRTDVLKSIAFKYRKFKLIRCHGQEGCNGAAVYCRELNDFSGLVEKYEIECEAGHMFILNSADIKENDLIAYTKVGNDNYDRIWNGKTWEKY